MLPFDLVAGHPHALQYMPVSLLLHAVGSHWTLPAAELPDSLPPDLDRRGLFQLRPTYDYLSAKVGEDYVSFRRTSFLAMPADTITVYAAQGGTFPAVIADMHKPPTEQATKHWLACYVMLSRASGIDNFLVLRPATRDELSSRPPQYLLDELDRLAKAEKTSFEELMAYIDALPLDVPSAIVDLMKPAADEAQVREVQAVRSKRSAVSAQRAADAGSKSVSLGVLSSQPAEKGLGASLSSACTTDTSVRPRKRLRVKTCLSGSPAAGKCPNDSSSGMAAAFAAGTMAGIMAVGVAGSSRKSVSAPAAPVPPAGVSDDGNETCSSSSFAAAAAEKRARDAAARGVADGFERANRGVEVGEVFGARNRADLRAALEESRRRLSLSRAHGSSPKGHEMPAHAGCREHVSSSGCGVPPGSSAGSGGQSGVSAEDRAVHAALTESSVGSSIAEHLPKPVPCTAVCHTCAVDVHNGCSSCAKTCHRDCSSALCEFTPCPFCLSLGGGMVVPADSQLCREVQASDGCHTCGKLGCRTSSPTCPAKTAANSADLLHIEHTSEKPRVFRNVMHERGGGGSCWINAALQALLSPLTFKAILAKVWRSLPGDARKQLHRINTTSRSLTSFVELSPHLLSYETRLSATMFSSYVAPRTVPMCPYVFTDAFYRGLQEDASEFISRVLHPHQSPALQDVLRGRWNGSLSCTNPACGHKRPTTGECFTSLQLPLLAPTGLCVQSVQEALDGFLPDETVQLDECCARCGHSGQFLKTHEMTCFPEVLIVGLNRWTEPGVENAVLHSIEASRSVRLKDRSYSLCASVCHLGPNPNSGHYVAVTRHPTRTGEWWLYDDAHRDLATDEQVSTLCSYGPWGPMQCYVLVYERR